LEDNNNVHRKAGQQVTSADGLQPPLISVVERNRSRGNYPSSATALLFLFL